MGFYVDTTVEDHAREALRARRVKNSCRIFQTTVKANQKNQPPRHSILASKATKT